MTFRCMELLRLMLLNPRALGTKKAMKGRKSGLSGEIGHFPELSY
jgi:hypothetical protein